MTTTISDYYMRARHNAADARRAIRLAEERESYGRREEATALRMWALDLALIAIDARERARARRRAALIAELYERARKVLREARWYRHDRLLFTACLVTARRCRREAREARQRTSTA
jgi:hypothetical protein